MDFYAVIRDDSKYRGQDDGKPFPVSLTHSPDGYIWSGNYDRYRMIDLVLLRPSLDPTVPPPEHVGDLVFEDKSAAESEGAFIGECLELMAPVSEGIYDGCPYPVAEAFTE